MEIVYCQGCGEPIPPKRLEILPKTRHCVNCVRPERIRFNELPGTVTVQHTGGLHEKYLREEDIEKR